MLNDSDHKYWKMIAEHDIDTVDLLLKENGHIDVTIYHMHQAVEKTLKGLIVKNGKEIPFIHDLKRLYAILRQIDGAFPDIEEAIINLQNFYKDLRYPMSDMLSDDDIKEANICYQEIMSVLFNKIN